MKNFPYTSFRLANCSKVSKLKKLDTPFLALPLLSPKGEDPRAQISPLGEQGVSESKKLNSVSLVNQLHSRKQAPRRTLHCKSPLSFGKLIFAPQILVLIVLSLGFVSCKQFEEKKPNVVMIVIDDLGWADLGYMGSNFYETPNIDQLANEGLVFTNAYAGAANCAPSRACLLTGLNTPRHGVYTVSPSARGKEKKKKITPTTNINFVDTAMVTLADEMRNAGYVTCNIGKWHIGENPGEQGIDVNIAGGKWGHPKSYFAPYIYPEIDAPEGEYLTDRLTNEAIKFVTEHKDDPFFLYLPYYTVHTPLQCKPEVVKKYKAKAVEGNCQNHATYGAMVELMDENVGRLLATLKELDLEENTLIFFTSDNGGIRMVSCQDPLRAGKGSYYEGGIRVPLIVKWPGKINASAKSEEKVVNLDFYPTVLEAIGEKPLKQQLDGVSILPLLTNNDAPAERPLIWHFPIYLQAYKKGYDQSTDPLFRTRPGSVILLGDWKLHQYFENNSIELYNLKEDLGEQNNLAGSHPEKVNELLEILDNWRKETGAPVPQELNPKYDAEVEQKAIEKIHKKLENMM